MWEYLITYSTPTYRLTDRPLNWEWMHYLSSLSKEAFSKVRQELVSSRSPVNFSVVVRVSVGPKCHKAAFLPAGRYLFRSSAGLIEFPFLGRHLRMIEYVSSILD